MEDAGEDDEENDEETGDPEDDAMAITLAKGERVPAKAVPVKAKSVTRRRMKKMMKRRRKTGACESSNWKTEKKKK